MPELPEVETTRRGISPHICGRRVLSVCVRQPKLRWPVSPNLAAEFSRQTIKGVERRGKYLLLHSQAGTLLIHLGMSGSLRLLPTTTPGQKHDHVDIILDGGHLLRYTDPRRFGCLLWVETDPMAHPLLRDLGPEPLSQDFTGARLAALASGRRCTVKSFIMDSRVVVGVGNIYANEALFMAGIHPGRKAGRISAARYERLVNSIRLVLERAISQGGTTLRDFVGGDGRPGYFSQALSVYGRSGQPCMNCGQPLREIRLGQRSTVYCPGCQR